MLTSEEPADPDSDDEANSDGTDGDSAPRRVDTPGELIAAIPAIFGFLPSRSLVVALLTTASEHSDHPAVQSIQPMIRFDVDAATDEHLRPHLTATVASIALRKNAVATMAVVIDDRPGAVQHSDHVLQPLRDLSIPLSNAWFVETIAPEAPYRDLLVGEGHSQAEDPAARQIAFADVLDDTQIRCSRDKLVDSLAPDTDLVTEVAAAIGAAFARCRDERDAAIRDGRSDEHRRDAAEWMLDQIDSVTANPPTADDLATLAAVVRDRPIRDIMFALTTTPHSVSAHMMWQHLARATTGTDRAGATVLFAHSSYCGGHTVLAGIAIDEALRADPTHQIAVLLGTALREGIPPHELTQLAEGGHEVARTLGVDITTNTR
ncbi:DUF4192 domain-containing protein [Nocardia sp. A7]|uniref:DUF4192 domain-containing protein n=1 Tax=Nocardia sp. A7 TaxID=2789274 RepID=UPI00397C02AE